LFHRPPNWLRAGFSRPTFHIWPQASHRQYVFASTFSLGVDSFDE
jgi:hypothetical protein